MPRRRPPFFGRINRPGFPGKRFAEQGLAKLSGPSNLPLEARKAEARADLKKAIGTLEAVMLKTKNAETREKLHEDRQFLRGLLSSV